AQLVEQARDDLAAGANHLSDFFLLEVMRNLDAGGRLGSKIFPQLQQRSHQSLHSPVHREGSELLVSLRQPLADGFQKIQEGLAVLLQMRDKIVEMDFGDFAGFGGHRLIEPASFTETKLAE